MIKDSELIQILTRLHDETGVDFTQYKEPTIRRRVAMRMSRLSLDRLGDYLELLKTDKSECEELIKALAINVTEFFRNPESFDAIRDIVIPRVIYSKKEHHHKIIKLWSCGCSSGDEPYSLAMLLLEKLGDARLDFTITIIGSDIDNEALNEAKNMVYSRERIKAIDNGLIEKYFDSIGDDNFKLKGKICNLVRFRNNDIVKDTPFMHCDVILCRNLLIYFNKQLQEETILKLYACLNPGGYLVLGMTESLIGSAADMFENVNNRLRIYRRPEIVDPEKENGGILSQDEVDRLVKEMLDS